MGGKKYGLENSYQRNYENPQGMPKLNRLLKLLSSSTVRPPESSLQSTSREAQSSVKVTHQFKDHFCPQIWNRTYKPALSPALRAPPSLHKSLLTALAAPGLGINRHEQHRLSPQQVPRPGEETWKERHSTARGML